LLDVRMADGSRHFGDVPERYDVEHPEWHRLADHVRWLAGAVPAAFVTDDVTEAWIDFELGGQRFSINNQMGAWWFFVQDPACPDELMERVLVHFGEFLEVSFESRQAGPLEGGALRVVVHHEGGRVTWLDFPAREAAIGYADDWASEAEAFTRAYVCDAAGRVVHVGRHY
jgi:hypothetical protein